MRKRVQNLSINALTWCTAVHNIYYSEAKVNLTHRACTHTDMHAPFKGTLKVIKWITFNYLFLSLKLLEIGNLLQILRLSLRLFRECYHLDDITWWSFTPLHYILCYAVNTNSWVVLIILFCWYCSGNAAFIFYRGLVCLLNGAMSNILFSCVRQ